MAEKLPALTLVLGGARSGKSRHAEALVEAAGGGWYIATAQALDDEMRERIAWHRTRRGPCWQTIEEPVDLPATLDRLARQKRPILVDCLTLWVSNLLCAGHALPPAQAGLLAALAGMSAPVIVVTNETGLGIVPDNALARRLRDACGLLNQAVAAKANRVLFLVAGLPVVVKG